MRKVLIRLLVIQVVAGIVIAAGFFIRFGGAAAAASIYGTGIALLVSLLLAWRLNQAAQPGNTLRGLFIGAVERMFAVGALFAIGIGGLQLAPLAIIIGFAGAELAYYAASAALK